MKKIILLAMILLLSGCFENSGYLMETCEKKETANTLSSITTYTFGFRSDIIDELNVVEHFEDSNGQTISSIKLSIETQNKYFKGQLSYNILTDNNNEYKIEYNLPLEEKDILKDKFVIKNKRSQLVKELKEQGFTCK